MGIDYVQMAHVFLWACRQKAVDGRRWLNLDGTILPSWAGRLHMRERGRERRWETSKKDGGELTFRNG